MTWLAVLASLFVLIALTALVSWLVLYFQFSHSVEKRWASQVVDLLRDAERSVRSENRELQELKTERDAKAHSIHEQAFHDYLGGISVNELEAYPGIGPGTVGKLRAAGFTNLATLRAARIHIHGLGEKRLTDIDYAVRELLRKARSTFDAGTCPQARSLADRREELSAKYDRLEKRARTRARAAKEFIDRLAEIVGCARAVTFWRWFRPISNEAVVPSELMDTPLPDLEAALRTAEDRTAQREIPNRPQIPAKVVPAIPISAKRQAVPHAQAQSRTPLIAFKAEAEMPDETHVLLMELTIQFALAVARADGPVTLTERELVRQHICQRFSYNRALLNRAEAFCAHYEEAAIDLERCLAQINERFTTGHRTALMAFAGKIVGISGKETSQNAPFLHDLAQRLGVPPLALPKPVRPPQPLTHPKPSVSPSPMAASDIPPPPPAEHVAVAASAIASRPSNLLPCWNSNPACCWVVSGVRPRFAMPRRPTRIIQMNSSTGLPHEW